MKSKLLVADDSVTIQKIIAMAFEHEDMVIESVSDGKSAFKRLSKTKPDIIVANVDLPKINGFELSKKIKSTRRLKSIPVLLLTSDFEDFDEARFKESKANDYITKPFKSEDIVASVKNLLNKKTASKKQGKIETVAESIQEVDEVEVTQSEESGSEDAPVTVEIDEEHPAKESVPLKLSSIDILEDSSTDSGELEEVVILDDEPQEDLEEAVVADDLPPELVEAEATTQEESMPEAGEDSPSPDDIPTLMGRKDQELRVDDAKEMIEDVFVADEPPTETGHEEEGGVEDVPQETLEEVAVLSEHSMVDSTPPEEKDETNSSSINNLSVEKPMSAEPDNKEMSVEDLLKSAKELLGDDIDQEETESEDAEMAVAYEEIPLRVEPLKEWVPPPMETQSKMDAPGENEIMEDQAQEWQKEEVPSEFDPENESADSIMADTAPLQTESLEELEMTFKKLHHLTGKEEPREADPPEIEDTSLDEEKVASEMPEPVSVHASPEQDSIKQPDLIQETLANLSSLTSAPKQNETPPVEPPEDSTGDAPIPDVMGEKLQQALDESLQKLIEKEIAGLSRTVERTVKEIVREIAPAIARKIIKEEVEKIKRMEEA